MDVWEYCIKGRLELLSGVATGVVSVGKQNNKFEANLGNWSSPLYKVVGGRSGENVPEGTLDIEMKYWSCSGSQFALPHPLGLVNPVGHGR